MGTALIWNYPVLEKQIHYRKFSETAQNRWFYLMEFARNAGVMDSQGNSADWLGKLKTMKMAPVLH